MTREAEILKTLTEARALITPRRRWTKHVYARTFFGKSRLAIDPDASRFCASGAIMRVSGGFTPEFYRAESALNAQGTSYSGVPRFNDRHRHKEVLAIFDRAIDHFTKVVQKQEVDAFVRANERLMGLVRESEIRDRTVRLAELEARRAEIEERAELETAEAPVVREETLVA